MPERRIRVEIEPFTLTKSVIMYYPLPDDWSLLTPGEQLRYLGQCAEATMMHHGPCVTSDVEEY